MNCSSAIVFPFYKKEEGYHWHCFFILGVSFIFIVGRMSGKIGRMYEEKNISICFGEKSFLESDFFKTLPEGMLKAKGRLAKFVAEAENF